MSAREQFEARAERDSRSVSEASEIGVEREAERQFGEETGRAVVLEDASLDESEVTVRQGGGWLAALEVRPSVECTWSGFDDVPAEVGATLLVRVDGESCFDPVATELLPIDGRAAGTTTLEFAAAHDVVETTSLDAVDFEPPWRADRPRTRTLTLRLVVDLLDDEGKPLCGDVATTECDVFVEAGDGERDDRDARPDGPRPDATPTASHR